MTRGHLDEDTTDHGEKMLEFHGIIHLSTAKAYKFEADNWNEAAWIPKSQSTIVEIDESNGRATLHIKKWLADKNGWKEL